MSTSACEMRCTPSASDREAWEINIKDKSQPRNSEPRVTSSWTKPREVSSAASCLYFEMGNRQYKTKRRVRDTLKDDPDVRTTSISWSLASWPTRVRVAIDLGVFEPSAGNSPWISATVKGIVATYKIRGHLGGNKIVRVLVMWRE